MPMESSGDAFTTVSGTTLTLASIDTAYEKCTVYIESDTGVTSNVLIEGSYNGQTYFSMGDPIQTDANTRANPYVNEDFIPHLQVLGYSSGAGTDATVKVVIHYKRRGDVRG